MALKTRNLFSPRESRAHAKASGKLELTNMDLADSFRRWTGAADGANVFLTETPHRIKAHTLYPSQADFS